MFFRKNFSKHFFEKFENNFRNKNRKKLLKQIFENKFEKTISSAFCPLGVVHYATTLLHDTTLRYTTALLHSYTPLHFHTYPLLQKDKLIVRIDKLQYCKARRIPHGVYCDTRPFLSEKRARPKNAPCPKPSTKREGMFGHPPIGLTMSTPP